MSMFIGMGFLGVQEDKYQRTQKLASASDHICCASHHAQQLAQDTTIENPQMAAKRTELSSKVMPLRSAFGVL